MYNVVLMAIVFIATFILSMLITWIMNIVSLRLDITAIDVHKLDLSKLPRISGISIPISLIISLLMLSLLNIIEYKDVTLPIIISLSLIMLIGLLDDLLELPGYYKPLACMLGGLPLILFRVYCYKLRFPLGIGFRIPLLYPIFILIGFSVSANTVNMLDVINGSAATGVLLVLITALIDILILHIDLNPLLIVIGIAAILGFLYFNKYPARCFPGNVGTLSMGGYLALIAIYYRIEFPIVVAMLPFIHNSFIYLGKLKKFVEHKKHGYKITLFDDKGLIRDACELGAPITLIRFLVSDKAKTELELYYNIVILFIVSSVLSVISSILY